MEKTLCIQSKQYQEDNISSLVNNRELVFFKWTDLDTFQELLNKEDSFAEVIFDTDEFKDVKEFYLFLCLCDAYGIDSVFCKNRDLSIKNLFEGGR